MSSKILRNYLKTCNCFKVHFHYYMRTIRGPSSNKPSSTLKNAITIPLETGDCDASVYAGHLFMIYQIISVTFLHNNSDIFYKFWSIRFRKFPSYWENTSVILDSVISEFQEYNTSLERRGTHYCVVKDLNTLYQVPMKHAFKNL